MTQIELETMSAVKNAAWKYAQEGIDWEQRRYEIAKDVLPSLMQVGFDVGYPLPQRVNLAIAYADELIKQLKGGEK